jgi:WD40 repeat protein
VSEEFAAADTLASLAVGSRIAGYLLAEQIGAGGMAVVFRAVDERPHDSGSAGYRLVHRLDPGAKGNVESVAFSPAGGTFAAGSANGSIYLWNVTRGRPGSPAATRHDPAGEGGSSRVWNFGSQHGQQISGTRALVLTASRLQFSGVQW